MPLKDLYVKLLSIWNIALILVPPLQPSFHVWYMLDLTCEYHAGNPSHGIETYYTFRKKKNRTHQDRMSNFQRYAQC